MDTVEPGTGIDLWEIAGALNASPGAALVLAFDVESGAARKGFLLLGCSGKAAVLVNGRTVFALLGGTRALLRNQDVVELPLTVGKNVVQVVFDRGPWAKIPADHFEQEWAVTLELADSPDAAWKAHAAQVFHPLIDPVVARWEELRSETALIGHNSARLYDLGGNLLLSGEVCDDFTIGWEAAPRLPAVPFAGMVVIGDDLGEMVVITGDSTLEQACAAVERSRKVLDPTDAWYLRLRQLLSPAFLRDRDLWWRRKLAIALVMSVVSADDGKAGEVLKRCKPSRIEYRSYVSAIDGTKQYYQLFRCDQPERAPLAVSFPVVRQSLRPFLEGGTVANQRGLEYLASVGDQYGMNLLWPGVLDADYGGHLLRRGVRECVEAASRDLGVEWSGGVYGIGECSAGVGALGYAKDGNPMNGVALHAPILTRTSYRWLPKIPQFPTGYSRKVLEREQVGTDGAGLTGLPIQLIYDIAMPGHGDAEGSRLLVERLTAAGADIEAEWPEPSATMPWGERGKVLTGKWFTHHRIEPRMKTRPEKGVRLCSLWLSFDPALGNAARCHASCVSRKRGRFTTCSIGATTARTSSAPRGRRRLFCSASTRRARRPVGWCMPGV